MDDQFEITSCFYFCRLCCESCHNHARCIPAIGTRSFRICYRTSSICVRNRLRTDISAWIYNIISARYILILIISCIFICILVCIFVRSFIFCFSFHFHKHTLFKCLIPIRYIKNQFIIFCLHILPWYTGKNNVCRLFSFYAVYFFLIRYFLNLKRPILDTGCYSWCNCNILNLFLTAIVQSKFQILRHPILKWRRLFTF